MKYKKTKNKNNEYYNRELLLNKKIKEFQNNYYNLDYPLSTSQYHEMDMLRREIKYLLGCQEYKVWQKSYRRKHAYFDQLSLFKSIYMMWKKLTFFKYIEEYHNVPHHISLWIENIGAKMLPGEVFGT